MQVMKKHWNRFFWPMTGLVAVLIIVTGVSYWKYGATFWNIFYPQFIATVFGVVFSIMFAWALWRLQQRVEQSRLRRHLIEALKLEIDENVKRLEDTERFFDDSKRQGSESATWRGLRTVAAKHILKPENLVIVKDVQVEDDVEWMLMHVGKYNTIFVDASRQFHNYLLSGKDIKAAESQMRSHILSESDFQFLKGFLKHLSQRIAGIS